MSTQRGAGEGGPALPAAAWVLALASLEDMGPARLSALLARHQPRKAYAEVRAGRGCAELDPRLVRTDPMRLARRWAAAARSQDVPALWDRHVQAGLGVAWRGGPSLPGGLADDLHAPELVVWAGAIEALAAPRVAVVGTRDCSRSGRDLAYQLGRDLAGAGVAVVSGLALGIDGAAHRGALDAGGASPVGVVAAGLDVVYPRRNAQLWAEVVSRGLMLTENPLGTPVAPWRFPARNRIIAALSDVVVVVESHSRGGALVTAEEAMDRSRRVMAVPGPVGSSSAAGTNALLADGCGVCRGAEDVLEALGLESAALNRQPSSEPPPSEHLAVLEAVAWRATSVDELVAATGRSVAQIALSLQALEDEGWIARRGAWVERVAPGSTAPSHYGGER